MKYVPQSIEAARQWVSLFSLNLEISRHEASSIYAQLCGVGTWKSLLESMSIEKSSNFDEDIHPKILIKRRAYYSNVLVDNFGFNRVIADYVAQKFSPSSRSCPEILSIDLNRLRSRDESIKSLGIDNIQKSISDYASNQNGLIANDPSIKTYTYDQVASLIRVKIKISPAFWFNLLNMLGWTIANKSYIQDYEFGRSSFTVLSGKTGESIPVYIVPLTRYPYDYSDSACNKAMQDVEADFKSHGHSKAILFWYALTSKKIHGVDYTHPGMIYTKGKWRETLINSSMHDIEDCIDCSIATPNINKPDIKYSDRNGSLILGFQLMFSRVASLSDLRLVGASSPTGWIALVTLPKDRTPLDT